MIKIGQIGIGHNHAEAKMLAVRKFPELFMLSALLKKMMSGYVKEATPKVIRDLKD